MDGLYSPHAGRYYFPKVAEMYLSEKQTHALEMALDAMDYRNSGAKDEEQEEAYDTICEMLKSAAETKVRQKKRRDEKSRRNSYNSNS